MIAVLSGGTGTPKLLQGLVRLVGQDKISVIVNTGEDLEVSGLCISPDLDTVMYTLAGIVNEETWYGIRGDTFTCHEMLKRLGEPELLRIGDRDRAVKLRRTLALRQERPLSEVTQELCHQLGVRVSLLPMSDDRVQTRVETEAGPMSFHEFWVRRRAADMVKNVRFEGAEEARPAPGVLEAIKTADLIIIGPSNPVTSIGPILAIEDIQDEIIRNRERVVAVSPIVGNAAVSGPAGELMRGLGYKVSPLGVAKVYRGIIGSLVLDWSDRKRARAVEEFGISTALADLLMPNVATRVRLAREVLEIARVR